MASLARCAKDLNIDADDVARAKELTKQFKSEGFTQSEAESEAVEALMGEVRTERTNAVSQIEKAGGVAPTRGEAANQKALSLKESVEAEVEGVELLDIAAKESGDASYKAIAKRIKGHVPKGIQVVHIQSGVTMTRPLPSSASVSKGIYWRTSDGDKVLALKGTGFEQGGVNPETVLHELIHAATVERIEKGNLKSAADTNPELSDAVSDLYDLQKAVAQEYKRRKAAGELSEGFESENQIIAAAGNVKELVAWGLTNSEFQTFLKSVEVEGTTAWGKFVDVVRRALGIAKKDTDALARLISLTDDVLSAPMKEKAKKPTPKPKAESNPKPEPKEPDLPPILTKTKKQYIKIMVKEAGMRASSPELEEQYEVDVDKALASLTFKQFNDLNSDTPEGINRSAYDAMQEDPQFSLDDATQLSALHNLTSENLLFADELGGMPAPSIGVVTGEMGIEGYGDITLIGTKNLADPSRVEVFDADAYTATFPRAEYNKVKSKDAMVLVDEIRPFADKYGDNRIVDNTFDYAVNTPKPDEITSKWINSNAAKAMYIKETTGVTPRVPMRGVPLRYEAVSRHPSIQEFFSSVPDEVWGKGANSDEQVQLRKDIVPLLEQALKGNKWGKNYLEKDVTNGEMSFNGFNQIHEDQRDIGKTQIHDLPLREKLDKQLKGKEAKFQDWVTSKVMGMFDEPYLKLGRKKVAYDLENIVEQMTDARTQGAEDTMTFGPGKARAAASTQFDSMDWMRNAAKGNLAQKSELKDQREEAERLLSEYRDAVIEYYTIKDWKGNVDTWAGLDDSMKALAHWAKTRLRHGSKSALKKALSKNDFRYVPDYVIEKGLAAGEAMLDAPVPYFEAKPQRAVGLDEFAGAVVPNDVSKDVLAVLDKNGIKYKKYGERYDEEARTKAVVKLRKKLSKEGSEVLFRANDHLQAKSKTDFTKPQAEAAVQKVIDNVKADVKVKVITSDEIPPNIQRKIPKGKRPKGFAVGDTAYIVADHLTNARDAQVTLAHELKGHVGVNNIIEEWSEVESLFAGLEKRGGKQFDSIMDEVDSRNPGADELTKIKEFIAIAAEQRETEGSVGAFMRKVREFLKKALNAMGFKPISMTDIDLILSRSEAYLAGEEQAEAEGELQFSLGGEKTFDVPVEKRVDTVIRKFQDKFKPVLMTQKEIAKSKGEDINETEDAYLAEELFYGKTEEDLRVLSEEYIEPLAEGLAEYEITREELDEWLTANHAKERNKQIAKINPDLPDGGSGMTNAEADQVHAMANPKKTKQLDELSGYVYDLLEHKRNLIRSGLQSDEITDAWESTYENYVPLKGMAENEEGTAMKTGSGYDIRGKETMRAMGRRSKAESPTLHAIRDVTETTIRYRKNQVGNTFLRLVEENPNKDYWKVFTEDNPDTNKRIVKTADGEIVKDVPINMQSERDSDGSKKYFATKRDGKTYYIKIEDTRLNRALQNMGPEQMNILTRSLGNVTRFLSSMSTSYNPEFMVSNVSRDVQTAVLNLMAEQDIPGGKAKGKDIALKMVKSIPIAMRAIHSTLRKKELTGDSLEWQKTFEQFREDGAKTGWFDMKEVDQQAADLNRMISKASGGVPGRLRAFADGTKEFVENANTAVENAVRLSVYKHGIDAGLTRKKAASLAKNLTVNFNRKGELGAVMNSLYMFSNASIQGTAVFARAMGTMKVDPDAKSLPVVGQRRLNAAQKVAAGMVGSAFALSMLNREMSDDDDDGVNLFDKVPGHVRERNIVIMKSIFGGEPGEFWTIPLPYGFNIFSVMGDTAESAINSDYRSDQELAIHMVMSVLGSFSPLGFETSKDAEKAAIKTITPTVGKPFVQLAVNENFYGGSIFKENSAYGVQRPDSALARRNTKPHWQAISTFMNEATGGSAFREGFIDVSPDTLGHLFDFATGGAGKFASMSAGAVEKTIKGEPMEDREIPFLRKVSSKVQEFDDQSRFYDRSNEIKQHVDELKSLRGPEKIKFLRENKTKLQLFNMVKAVEKELSKLRKGRKEIELSDLSDKRKDEMIEKIEDKMDVVIDIFNKKYDKVTK